MEERIIGDYRLIQPIHTTAESTTWLAEQTSIRREVTVIELTDFSKREAFLNDTRAKAYTVTGGSIGTITDWTIQVLNEEGNPASSPGDARQVFIAMEAASPVDVEVRDGVTIRDTRWQSTFRPRMLRDSSL